MKILVDRDGKGRLVLAVQFPQPHDLANLVVSKGYQFDDVRHPLPDKVVFVFSPRNGPKSANILIGFLKNNYAVKELTWKTR